MSIKLDIKTSVVDKNVKVDSVDVSKNAPLTDDSAEVQALLEDMPGMESMTSTHEYTPFDDYMCGDMNPEAIQETTTSIQNIRSLPPTLEDLIAANPKVRQNLEMVIDHYKRTEQNIKDHVKTLTDLQFTGQVTADESSRITQKIEMYNGAASRCLIEAQKAETMWNGDVEMYRKEFRLGDINNDGFIGTPYGSDSIGVHTLHSGEKIYINTTTGVAYNHPPYADMDYEPIIGRGYAISDREAPDYTSPLGVDDEGNQIPSPTTDLEIYVSDLNALEGSAFGVPAELMGVQYFWVKADGEKSFESKDAFRKGTTDSTTDTERHYEIAGFEMVGDQIVQKKPEDISQWVQKEVGEMTVTSREVDGGKGFVHYIEYLSADPSRTLIARICIRETKVDSWIPAATSELYASLPADLLSVDPESRDLTGYLTSDEDQVELINTEMSRLGLGKITESEWSAKTYSERMEFLTHQGPTYKVYASSSALAISTDNILSYGMMIDASKLNSTARLTTTIEQLEQALNLTRPAESDEKAYRAYMENLSAFTDRSQMWAFHANKYRRDGGSKYIAKDCTWQIKKRNDYRYVEIARNFDSDGYASVYIDPASREAQAQVFNHRSEPDFVELVDMGGHWNDGERPITETMSSQITGVLVYGKGRIGHVIGTSEYNDIFHIAEKNARLDELQERFDWAEPIMPESAFNSTVIECGNGNDIVRGYDANHYITGVTMAVIESENGVGDNFIKAQEAVEPALDDLFSKKMERKGKHRKGTEWNDEAYDVLDSNAKHFITVQEGGEVHIDNMYESEENVLLIENWSTGETGNLALGYYKDDHYDVSTNALFGNTDDPNATTSNLMDEENSIKTALNTAAEEIRTEREKVEIPDYIEAAAEEWMTQYGGSFEEMQNEMDSFFGTVFGEMDTLWSDLAEEEAGQTIGSPTEADFMKME